MRPIYTTKKLLKLSLPRRTQLALRSAVNRTKGEVLSLGSSVECPICGQTFFSFLSFCGRRNEWCPFCRSLGRHRLTYLYLRDRTDLLSGRRPIRILHVGPEFCLRPVLASVPRAIYLSTDLMVSIVDLLEIRPDIRMSVTDACFPSDMFDLAVCSHVLEHVKKDQQALAELFRVMKIGGIAIVPVPINWTSAITQEKDGLNAAQRAELYGEADHVRQYGRDYLDRLSEAGFGTELYRPEPASLGVQYRIDMNDPLVVAHKL